MSPSSILAGDSRSPAHSLWGQGVEVRWSAVLAAANDRHRSKPAHQRHTFVITLRRVDDDHALVEAWLETPQGLRPVLRRQPLRCKILRANGLLHVDAYLDGHRVIALSVALNGAEPLYARTTLLESAGFAPGAYDPPTARLLSPETDAASA